MEQSQRKEKTEQNSSNIFPWKLLIICLTFIFTISIGALILWQIFTKTVEAPGKIISKSLDKFSSLFSEKNDTGVRIAAFLTETNVSKFQFKKRNMLLLFQMIRWRDPETSMELNDARPGIMNPKNKNILLDQYTIAEATGEFEITFLIDMKHQNQWKYSWNNEQKTLTITAPSFKTPLITYNTPALTSELDIFIKTDCATFDEDTTKNMLKQKIPFLKDDAALKQLPYIREDARVALEKFFHNLLSRMTGAEKSKFSVKVKFQDDTKANSENLEKPTQKTINEILKKNSFFLKNISVPQIHYKITFRNKEVFYAKNS